MDGSAPHLHGTSPDDRAADPFAPEGVAWQPVSPRLAVARLIVSGVWMALLAAAVLVLAGLTEQSWIAWAALVPPALMVWLWWLIRRQVAAFGYAERDEDLLVRHGILWRYIVVVPYGRLQYVDVEAGPLSRALGITQLQLHTASAATDARIPGLAPQQAALLRDRLTSRGQARLAGL